MKSIKKLMDEYKLSEGELSKIMHVCLSYYLSEEELYQSILEFYMKKEMRINKRLQR